jgi:high affinity sulfate transporter 1
LPDACARIDDGGMNTQPHSPFDSPRHSRHRESGWQHWLPGLRIFRAYPIGWLRHDLVAGLVLTSLLVPSGIAYAAAAGVPGVYGLYASIVPLLVYALFGPNRVLVMGPDSALAALILSVIMAQSGGDPQRAVALAGAMAMVAGVVCVAGGFARFGFVAELLSKPIRYGFMNGIALTLLLSQLPRLFGIDLESSGLLATTLTTVRGVFSGETNVASLAIGVGCFALIMILKRYPNVPGTLIAIGGATVIVGIFDLGASAGVAVLGPMPSGLPTPKLPLIGAADIVPVLLGGTAVALVAFADTSVLSRTYAARLNLRVDPNQEMVGLGAVNLVTGLFQGFPVSSSATRTPVALAAGSKSQLTGVVGAITIALLLMFAPTLLRHLPMAALAAVVIAAAMEMFEVADLRRIYWIQRWEFWLSMVCFVGVVTLGAIEGIGLAIGIAVLQFLWDGWRPHSAVLGRVNHVKGYHDVTRYPDARRVPGLVLFRWDAPLFFANAELFRDRVLDAVAGAPDPVRRLVISAEPVTSVDVTAADVVCELDDKLRADQIELAFAEMKDPVKDQLKRFGLFEQIGADRFFATVGEAVKAYVAAFEVEWSDWEDDGQKRDSTRAGFSDRAPLA